MLAQQAVNGVVLGSVYALAALGFTLIFGAARVVNFAYGTQLMLGGFATLFLTQGAGLPFFAGLLIAMAVMAAASVVLFFVVVRPVLGRGALPVLLVTTGLLYMLRDGAVILFGTDPQQIDMDIDGVLEVGDVIVTYQRLVVVGVLLVMVVALYLVLYRSRIGKALRAVAQNRAGAEAIGLNVDRVMAFAFALSGALACAAGGLLGAIYAAEPGMGDLPLLKSFTIVIFGGLGSVPGAIVGGLVMGLVETLTGSYLGFAFKDVSAFVVLLVILLVRPAGLFGHSVA